MKVFGKAEFQMKIGDFWFRHEVLVAGVTNDGLIGFEFLTEHEMTLDFGRKQVKYRGETIKAQCQRIQNLVCRVAVKEGVLVPSGSRKIVEARTTRHLPAGTWLIEPMRSLPEKHSLLLARTLARGQGCSVPVELLNPTDENCYLYPGTHVGIASKAAEIPMEDEEAEPEQNATLPPDLEKLVQDIDAPLTPDQKQKVKQVLQKNRKVFSLPGDHPGRTNLVQHEIRVNPDIPIKQMVRRPPIHYREAGEKEVEKMLRDDVISPSNSPWASPVVLVRKKDGSLRYCVDYRKLNAVTIKDSYPLPRIDESLDMLGNAKYFTTLDLASGYWQIELTEDASEKSAFCTTTGLFQFNVMPFGLTNAPATFQRLMERVLAGLQWKICLVYIDDIIVFGRTVEEHLEQLQAVFSRLKAAGLKLKPRKCHLFKQQVQYLGHLVSENGIQTDPEKIKVIHDWKEPSTVTEVKSFLGLCSYYRKFVPDFATIARPLIKLTEKTSPLNGKKISKWLGRSSKNG